MFECRRLLAWVQSTGITRLLADHHRPPVGKPDIIARTRSASFSCLGSSLLCDDSLYICRCDQDICCSLLQPISVPQHQIRHPEYRRYLCTLGTPLRLQSKDAMAASLAAVKKELRSKIRDILKGLPEAAAATQSTSCVCLVAASTDAPKHLMQPKPSCPCPSTRRRAE